MSESKKVVSDGPAPIVATPNVRHASPRRGGIFIAREDSPRRAPCEGVHPGGVASL
jgi:hypothetical protein